MRPHPESLDAGIRETVLHLIAHGFDTCDSGGGTKEGMECAVLYPMVAATTAVSKFKAEAHRMQDVLDAFRPDYWRVEVSFCPLDGTCVLAAIPREWA